MNTAARQLPARDYLALKAVTRDLTDKAGGVTRAGQISRVGAPLLSRYGSPQESTFAPIDVIADLEAEVGDPVVTRELASLSGFDLVARPAPGASLPLTERFVKMLKENGDVEQAISRAIAAGEITAAEKNRLRIEIKEAMAQLSSLMAELDAPSALRPVDGRGAA